MSRSLAQTIASACDPSSGTKQVLTLLGAFGAVGEWIKAEGKEQASPPREVYFADWGAIGPDDPACDIAWPFR